MKLKMKKRSTERKSDANQLRREGSIPAVVYSQGKETAPIAIERAEFEALLRSIPKGHLATTKITLIDEEGKERFALVKDIQYHPTTYNVLHLDFEILHDDVKVKVNVPIECTGVVDCVGIKLGGVLRQVIRSLRVQCFPKDLPESFKLDVTELNMRDSKRLGDIQMSDTIRPLMDLNEVAVAIVKR